MSDMMYRLYASSSATANDAAHLDIQSPGMIDAVHFDAYLNTATLAAGVGVIAEISFAAVSYAQTNDVKSIIASMGLFCQFTTSGAVLPARNSYLTFPRGIPVALGDRLYLHFAGANGTFNVQASAVFFVSVGPQSRSMLMPASQLRRRR